MLDTAKAKMEPYEWAYWMEGKPADEDIKAPERRPAGEGRRGARRRLATSERMGGVACWNAVMDENNYMVQKWNEFVAA